MDDRRIPFALIAATICVVPTFAGCAGRPLALVRPNAAAAPAAQTAGVRNADELKKRVSVIVPSGTSLAHAEQIMRKEGFECSFAVDDDGVDMLRCVRHDDGVLLLPRRWTVEFPYRDGAILEARIDGAR